MNFFPKNFTIPKIPFTYLAIHAVQDFILELRNIALETSLVTLVYTHTTAIRALAVTSNNATPR